MQTHYYLRKTAPWIAAFVLALIIGISAARAMRHCLYHCQHNCTLDAPKVQHPAPSWWQLCPAKFF